MSKHHAVILVAGDSPNDLNNISTYLRGEGFGTITVLDRATIITIARSERPNLVLLDFDECLDVCRKLKRNFVTEPIPVIALLFPAEEADRVAILELGADDCMAKPYSRRELLLRIRASLSRARDKDGTARYRQSQYYSALTRRSSPPNPRQAPKG